MPFCTESKFYMHNLNTVTPNIKTIVNHVSQVYLAGFKRAASRWEEKGERTEKKEEGKKKRSRRRRKRG